LIGIRISASASASTSMPMRGMYMRGGPEGHMGGTASGTMTTMGMMGEMRMGSTSRRMGSTTRMSSTTRQEMMGQRQGQAIGAMDEHSSNEITARIDSLNTLSTRVNAMVKLSASDKTAISGEITGLISELTTLQAKIQADASSTPTGQRGDLSSSSPLRTDIQSITKDYRVYALVIPQTDILAAADRAQTLVTSFTTLAAKLQTRITAAQTAGHDVTALQASLSDLNTKIADAQTQATVAVSATANLTPDNGDTTIAASNTAALKTARTDIQTANSDIQTATTDAQSIVKGVEGFGGTASTSASVSGSVQ
jgi:hypothetical protein